METAVEPPAAPTPAHRRRRGRWAVVAGVAAALLLVWCLGGFQEDTPSTDETTGVPFDIGVARITVLDATAKRTYTKSWAVTVEALCTVTVPNPPMDFTEGFAVASTTKPTVVSENAFVTFASDDEFGPHRDYLGPGLAPNGCRFQASMPGTWRPDTGIRVGFTDYQFGDDSVTGDQAEHWHEGSSSHLLRLPVRVLRES